MSPLGLLAGGALFLGLWSAGPQVVLFVAACLVLAQLLREAIVAETRATRVDEQRREELEARETAIRRWARWWVVDRQGLYGRRVTR